MKLIAKTLHPVETPTFTVGQEIILTSWAFDGRTSTREFYALTVTKVNRITLIAADKQGNEYNVDPRTDSLTSREEIIKAALAAIN